MLEGDGVGLVRFNQDAQVLQPIVQLGSGGLSDINRSATKDIINGTGSTRMGRPRSATAFLKAAAFSTAAPRRST